MALTESIEYDKIEVIGHISMCKSAKQLSLKKMDVEITRSFEICFKLRPTLDESDNFVDNPLDKEPDGTTANR